MSETSEYAPLFTDLDCLQAASLAPAFPWLDSVLALLEPADCGTSSGGASPSFLPSGFSLRTCLVYYPAADVLSAAAWPCECVSILSESNAETRWREIVDAASAKSGDDYIRLIRDAISQSSSQDWLSWGMASRGGFLTLSGSASPSDVDVCSLSDVLEMSAVHPKFFLSQTACRGILRRAAKRGRALPEHLRLALEQAASLGQEEPAENT